jgi:hypothetical protein
MKRKRRRRNNRTITMMKGRIMKTGYVKKTKATVERNKKAGRKKKKPKLKKFRSI